MSAHVILSLPNLGENSVMVMTNTDWEFFDAEAMTQAGHDMWPAIKRVLSD